MSTTDLPSRGKMMLCALLPLGFLGLGIPDLMDTITLHRSHSEVDARVIDARTMSSLYGTSYQVKYVYQPALKAQPIGRKGLLHDDLWSSLPEAEWEKAIQAGYVSVIFDPSNPGNNAPSVQLPSLLDGCVPLAFGLLLSVGIVIIEVRRRRLRGTSSAIG